MSIMRCDRHGAWDSDLLEQCPRCEMTKTDEQRALRRITLPGADAYDWADNHPGLVYTVARYENADCTQTIYYITGWRALLCGITQAIHCWTTNKLSGFYYC